MKRPSVRKRKRNGLIPQSVIEEAQRWVDERVAMNQESLTKEGAAATALKIDAWTAGKICEQPERLMKFLDDLESQKLGNTSSTCNILFELAALYLERDQPPPQPLGKFVAKTLREASTKLQRGSLVYRNGEIAVMLAQLKKWGFPLFSTRNAPRSGQTYACDIVIKALEKVDKSMSSEALEKIWRTWSRFPELLTFINEKVV
jgi:hypothetical protein